MNTRNFIAWADQQHIERLSNPACHESYDPRLDHMIFWLPNAAPTIPSGTIDLVRGLLILVETAHGRECISWPISPEAERRDITGGRHGLIIEEARQTTVNNALAKNLSALVDRIRDTHSGVWAKANE